MSDGVERFRRCIDKLTEDLAELVKEAVAEEAAQLQARRRKIVESRPAAQPLPNSRPGASATGKRTRRRPRSGVLRDEATRADAVVPTKPPPSSEPVFVHVRRRDGSIVEPGRREQ